MARVSDTLLHGGGDARHSWPGSTLARNPTQVTQVSNIAANKENKAGTIKFTLSHALDNIYTCLKLSKY